MSRGANCLIWLISRDRLRKFSLSPLPCWKWLYLARGAHALDTWQFVQWFHGVFPFILVTHLSPTFTLAEWPAPGQMSTPWTPTSTSASTLPHLHLGWMSTPQAPMSTPQASMSTCIPHLAKREGTHQPICPLFCPQPPVPFLFTYSVSVLVVANAHYHCTQDYQCWIGGWLLLFTTLFSHLHGVLGADP